MAAIASHSYNRSDSEATKYHSPPYSDGTAAPISQPRRDLGSSRRRAIRQREGNHDHPPPQHTDYPYDGLQVNPSQPERKFSGYFSHQQDEYQETHEAKPRGFARFRREPEEAGPSPLLPDPFDEAAEQAFEEKEEEAQEQFNEIEFPLDDNLDLGEPYEYESDNPDFQDSNEGHDDLLAPSPLPETTQGRRQRSQPLYDQELNHDFENDMFDSTPLPRTSRGRTTTSYMTYDHNGEPAQEDNFFDTEPLPGKSPYMSKRQRLESEHWDATSNMTAAMPWNSDMTSSSFSERRPQKRNSESSPPTDDFRSEYQKQQRRGYFEQATFDDEWEANLYVADEDEDSRTVQADKDGWNREGSFSLHVPHTVLCFREGQRLI
ncbi:MAG: hypothetical protein SGILL_009226 [Bacillariaceae sp.]